MSCCGKAIKGASGLAKAALRIDRADVATVRVRRDVCRNCEHGAADGKLTSWTLCDLCRCNIAAKTVVSAEDCSRWRGKTGKRRPEMGLHKNHHASVELNGE